MLLFISSCWYTKANCYLVSIHLMLLFIDKPNSSRAFSITVSIHLMLLFILRRDFKCQKSTCFNTSHVTLYQHRISHSLCRILVSIHLMLLFIWMQRFSSSSCRAFQYISCYSLSYIKEAVTAGAYKFQYISCYSLSQTPEGIVSSYSSFNTSHVTLYRWTL